MPQFNKGKPKDVNMGPFKLANTEISTDNAQKTPRSPIEVLTSDEMPKAIESHSNRHAHSH